MNLSSTLRIWRYSSKRSSTTRVQSCCPHSQRNSLVASCCVEVMSSIRSLTSRKMSWFLRMASPFTQHQRLQRARSQRPRRRELPALSDSLRRSSRSATSSRSPRQVLAARPVGGSSESRPSQQVRRLRRPSRQPPDRYRAELAARKHPAHRRAVTSPTRPGFVSPAKHLLARRPPPPSATRRDASEGRGELCLVKPYGSTPSSVIRVFYE